VLASGPHRGRLRGQGEWRRSHCPTSSSTTRASSRLPETRGGALTEDLARSRLKEQVLDQMVDRELLAQRQSSMASPFRPGATKRSTRPSVPRPLRRGDLSARHRAQLGLTTWQFENRNADACNKMSSVLPVGEGPDDEVRAAFTREKRRSTFLRAFLPSALQGAGRVSQRRGHRHLLKTPPPGRGILRRTASAIAAQASQGAPHPVKVDEGVRARPGGQQEARRDHRISWTERTSACQTSEFRDPTTKDKAVICCPAPWIRIRKGRSSGREVSARSVANYHLIKVEEVAA
jgi:hypothetical protein